MASGSSHPPPQGPALLAQGLAQGLGLACARGPERRGPSPRGWHGQTAEAAAALRWRSEASPNRMPLPLAVQVLTMALALLCFNVAGVYITKLQSATHRACVDATRQAVVWMHALLVGWEEFSLVERDVESTARCGRPPARPNRLIGRGSPRLAEAPGSLTRGGAGPYPARALVPLDDASGEPASRGLSHLALGTDGALRLRRPRPRHALVQ